MEKFALILQSAQAINDYVASHWLMRYEKEIVAEILALIEKGDEEQLAWFAGFGEHFRHITMNVHEYREGLGFGFTEIAFNASGWFTSPKFLDFEELKLEASSIRIGRGPNGNWAYALSCSYGCAGHSGPLSVFCKKYPNRDAVLTAALGELKKDMLAKVGDTDRCNYHQDVIAKTLKAITKSEIGLVQMTLF
jgi:hypothetical protein